MDKKDQELALNLLKDFVDFVRIQEKADVIDGSADPALSIDITIRLLNKHFPLWDKPDFALSA